ncbi:hypothetical protein WA158_003434 [Blastocystis sp. Blastoise]
MSIADGWFSECEAMWPGQKFSVKVKDVLYHEKSKYQDILVFDSESYGRVLALDGVFQITEKDEFSYQEMIVNLPLFAHPNPKEVLIVGGGDGGVLREIARHDCIEHIVQCEIDEGVVNVAKKYFSNSTAVSFNDPRLELLFMDAAEYVKNQKNRFDVIIVDSSDPVGPAETLYTSDFYKTMKEALREGGIICTQGECQWLHLDLIAKVMNDASKLFKNVNYGYCSIPSYPCGQIGFIIGTLDDGKYPLYQPNRPISPELQSQLKYYTPEMHKAAFVLPRFAMKALKMIKP